MNIMKLQFLILLTVLITEISFGQTDDLSKDFKSPPAEYSLLPFWSWNGTLKPEKLTWQIDQMMDKGIKGAFMHARAGLDESETPYFSDGFWSAVDTTIKYSASKGFHTYLYDEDKWPSGGAGGRTIAANPEEFVKKILNYDQLEVVGPQTIRLNLQNNAMAVLAGQISEKGTYNFASQIDLTAKKNELWNVPKGRWMIISFEMIKDPGEQIDYLDSAAVAKFIEITHEEYFKRFGKYFGNTIPGIFFDEIYANSSKMQGNIFWTDDFLQKFRNIKGYDLAEKLSLIILNDPANSAKIRYDYFDVVKDLYEKAWFKQYADWCEAHHIFATGHTTEKMIHYKRQSDYFTTMGQLQVPGTDNEEYRYGYPRMIDWYNTKQISSIGNLYQRKRVMAESMGGGGYTIPLEEYRYGFSMLGVYGINMFIPHLFHYTMDTPESQSDWPPSLFFRNPYWKYFKPLADFGSRISYMISQGTEVCDVAILYPLTDVWEGGYPDQVDDTFYRDVQQILLDNHINYNIIDPSSFVNAKISDCKIKAGKGNYRILVLPEIHSIRMDVLKQLEDFVEAGGIVVSLKSLPAFSENGPDGNKEVVSSMKKLFGFHPGDLRQNEYYQWNTQRTEHFTAESNDKGGTAYFTRFISQLPKIINQCIVPDFVVKSENSSFLQFNHRNVGDQEVYLFVNDRNSSEIYHVSLRNVGRPSIWNPETGETHPFENYELKEDRLELILDFKPRESYFLVLDKNMPTSVIGLVTSTDLADYRLQKNDHLLQIEGWGKSGQEHFVTCLMNGQTVRKDWKGKQNLPELNLSENWQFRLVPNALDYQWSADPSIDTLATPVMKFQAERVAGEGAKNNWQALDFNDNDWKTIKVTDVYNQKPGVQRYLSGWDARWISYYDYSVHLPAIEGGDRTFRKEVVLDSPVTHARLAITADPDYELLINGQLVGKDENWETAKEYDISKFLTSGKNVLEVKTRNTRALLLQGEIRMEKGKKQKLHSDSSWQVSANNLEWQAAFNFAAPPMSSWGKVGNPLQKVEYPLTVWYRQQIPPGITAIKKPVIKGKYSLFVNGHAIETGSGKTIDIRPFLKNGANRMALKVDANDETCGLLQPLELVCGEVTQPLISWNNMGLGWYSGRALYTQKVKIPSDLINPSTRLILDLGLVDYFAEIWVNGNLVKYCSWAPFETDISGLLKVGENEISVVVANLQANRASWNILDDNISNRDARWWHNGSIIREKEKLTSGLLGPVRIVSLVKESIEIQIK